jgi:hypothetical protein
MRRAGLLAATLAAAACCAISAGAALGTGGPGAGDGAAATKGCTKAFVNGKPTCLRTGQRCSPRFQSDYLLVDLSCKHGKLRRASIAQRRHDDPLLVQPNGEISLSTALDAFDQTVADLPGVSAHKGELGKLPDATFAIEEIAGNLDKLTDEQRAVYTTATTPTSSKLAPKRVLVTPEEQARDLQYIDDARRVMAAHGYAFPRPITLSFTDDQAGQDSDTLAYTSAGDILGTSNTCDIFLLAKGRADSPDATRLTLSHETAHCAQHAFYTSVAGALKVPMWVKEGGADWLGASAAQEAAGVDLPNTHWNTWLSWPSFDLFTRSYPALGFFSMLQQAGIDTFQRYQDVMRGAVAGGSKGAFTAAIAGAPQVFTDRWGPGFVRDTSLGTDWDLTGPGIIPSKPPKVAITNGSTEGWSTEPRGAVGVQLVIKSDVFIVRTAKATRGLLRGSDGKQRKLQQGAYCATKSCKCKTHTELQLPKIGAGVAAAGFGDQKKVRSVVFEGESLKDYCAKPGPGPAPDPGGGCKPKLGTSRQDGASCPVPSSGIQVLGGTSSDNEQTVANFTIGDCTSGSGGFTAISSDGAWRLEVGIDAFSGFDQMYQIPYGGPDPEVVIDGPQGPYSNTTWSPGGLPYAGSINFDSDGSHMGLGFIEFRNASQSFAISAAGVMTCVYPDND